MANLERLLSPDESARARRRRFATLRSHFVVARAGLRTLLARYLRTDAARLRFGYGPAGKPFLRWPEMSPPLEFNLSHSAAFALVAVTRTRCVGVDLEHVQERAWIAEGIERFLAPAEQRELQRLPTALKRQAFFDCWTRKEAFVKARGKGLSYPFHRFTVSLTPGLPAALLACADDPQAPERWTLHALRPAPGYVGAVAVEGHPWRLECWRAE